MEYRILGRTGLRVSVMGLGAGGPSRLGQRDQLKTEAESVALVQQALDTGINFIDTAEAYGTEAIVGKAIAGRERGNIVISTKKSLGRARITPQDLRDGIDGSLRRLGTDYVDIYHLHGLHPDHYDYYRDEIVPALEDLRSRGKIRFTGVTEFWGRDLQHGMLQRALQDDCFDVYMVGFNLLNQTARETVLQPAMSKDIGILIMFAIRRALSRMDKLRETLEALIASGELDARDIDLDDPLGFLLSGGVSSIPAAAYRFCRDEPGRACGALRHRQPAASQGQYRRAARPAAVCRAKPAPQTHLPQCEVGDGGIRKEQVFRPALVESVCRRGQSSGRRPDIRSRCVSTAPDRSD